MTGTWAAGWATGDIVTAAEFKKGAGSISDTTLGGAAANIDITGIVATYAHLMVIVYARADVAATTTPVYFRFNGDTAANYDMQSVAGQAAAGSFGETFAGTAAQIGVIAANTAGANMFSVVQAFIPNYAGSTNNKQAISTFGLKIGTATTNMITGSYGSAWRSNAAINRVTILPASGNLVAGTRVTIYALGA